jgi:SAM-dependent methyltransferase
VGTADGILNLVTDPVLRLESEHFDKEYQEQTIREPRNLEALEQLWTDYPNAPMNRSMLKHIGQVEGSTILLLGNGVLVKELYLLTRKPAALVFSDLSVEAVRTVRNYFGFDGYDEVAFFAAIDAQQLPFDDASVDVVYGYAFVHHLPDVDRFLAEAMRVLRPGGRAVFMDNAMSPLWQKAKLGILRPLMHVAHRRNPVSDEDMRVTLTGGFDVQDFARRIRGVGGEPFFERSGLVHYLATRASDIFLRSTSRFRLGRREWELKDDGRWRLIVPYGRFLRAMIRIDDWLAHLRIVRDNQMRLVWGFTKPS